MVSATYDEWSDDNLKEGYSSYFENEESDTEPNELQVEDGTALNDDEEALSYTDSLRENINTLPDNNEETNTEPKTSMSIFDKWKAINEAKREKKEAKKLAEGKHKKKKKKKGSKDVLEEQTSDTNEDKKKKSSAVMTRKEQYKAIDAMYGSGYAASQFSFELPPEEPIPMSPMEILLYGTLAFISTSSVALLMIYFF